LQPLCRIFAVVTDFFAGIVAEIDSKEVKKWPASKRLQKKLAFRPPLFLAHYVDFIMSTNKLATKLLPLQKS
jgi:phage-related holin